MNRKKMSLYGGALFMFGLLAFTACGPRHRFCSDNFPDKLLKRMDRKIAKLELNSEQEIVYNKIRADIKIDLLKMKEARLITHDEIATELDNENPDMAKIADILKQRHANRPDKFESYADRIVEFYEILDENQKSKIIEKMRDGVEEFNCD